MNKSSRLDFLIETHKLLDSQILEMQKSKVWDDIELHELKKKKLKIKENIEHLKGTLNET